MSQYDYLVVGAGLSGAVFANAARRAGKSVLVIDRRDHIAGNVYTEDVEGIQVHRYGAHIFHTSMRDVWDYVNRFAEFNNYVNSPVRVTVLPTIIGRLQTSRVSSTSMAVTELL